MKKWYFLEFACSLSFERGILLLYLLILNYSFTNIAVLQSLLSFVIIFAEIPSGTLSDVIGRKRVFILSEICMCIFYIVFIFYNHSLELLMLGYIFYGLYHALSSGNNFSYMYEDVTKTLKNDEDKFNSFYGKANFASFIGFAVAIAAGGILFSVNIILPFVIALIIRIMIIVILYMYFTDDSFVKAKHEKIGSTIKNNFSQYLSVLKNFCINNKDKLIFYIAVAFFISILVTFDLQIQVLLDENNIDYKMNGLIQSALSIVAAIASLIFAKVVNIINYKKFVLFNTLFLVFLLMVILYNNMLLIVALVLINIIYAFSYPLMNLKVNQDLESEIRSTLNSVISLFRSLFIMVIFLLIALVNDKVNNLYTAVIFTVLTCTIIFGVLHTLAVKKNKIA